MGRLQNVLPKINVLHYDNNYAERKTIENQIYLQHRTNYSQWNKSYTGRFTFSLNFCYSHDWLIYGVWGHLIARCHQPITVLVILQESTRVSSRIFLVAISHSHPNAKDLKWDFEMVKCSEMLMHDVRV